jgi:hypothetical protein
VVVALSAPGLGQAPPSLNASILSSTNPLTAEQSSQLQQYIAYNVGQLKSTDGGEVRAARERVIAQLRTPGLTEVARTAFSGGAVPELQKVIREGQPHAAVNAVQVASFLGTSAAADLILTHADLAVESRAAVRLASAKGLSTAVGLGAVPANRMPQTLRDLGRAAQRENNPFVLRRQLEAFDSFNTAEARRAQTETIGAILERIAEGGASPSELVSAIYPVVYSLGNRFADLPTAEQSPLGRELGAALVPMMQIALNHWDTAHADPAMNLAYSRVLFNTEKLLRLIDRIVRGGNAGTPAVGAKQAWDDSKRADLEALHAQWQAIVEGPAYRP